eukprot:809332-Pyramimonas_sp.AAC.1
MSAPPAAPASISDQLFGYRATVQLRFPGLSAGELDEEINRSYNRRVEARPWFSDAGEELMSRHEQNKRRQLAVVQHYKKLILTDGLEEDNRSLPFG